MKVGCIILAHRNPRQLAEFLKRLDHPAVRVYLHLDSRVSLAPFEQALEREGLERVTLLSRRASRWGGIEVVDATLGGLAMAMSDGCEYFLTLSGQDWPLWPVAKIVEFFTAVGERSYVENFALPDSRWAYDGRLRTDFYTYTVLGRRETCIPRGIESRLNWKGRALNTALRMRGALKPPRRFPLYLRPFGGAQWWNVSRVAADFVLRFVHEHPDYRAYHEHTLLPDELFFQSILLGTAFADEHEVVNDCLRFMIWPAGGWHPRTLEAADVPEMLASGKPFARKLDLENDPVTLEALVEGVGG